MTETEVISHLNEKIDILNRNLGHFIDLNTCYFAGGCIRDLINDKSPKDYDIYFTVLPEYLGRWLSMGFPGQVTETKLSNWNINIENTEFQFITLLSGHPEEVSNSFDFTCNMNFFVFSTQELVVHPDAFKKALRVGGQVYRPVQALWRLSRFVSKGYELDPRVIIDLAEQATGVRISNERISSELGWSVSD